jgi:ribosomal protein S6
MMRGNLLSTLPCVKVRRHMGDTEVILDTDTADEAAVSRVYEAGYHISPLVKEEDIEKIVAEIRGVVEKGGGTFIAEGAPALIKLAYEIEGRAEGKKHMFDRGYFGWLKFEASSETADALKDALKVHADIFRSMVFRTVREETRARLKAPQLREVKRPEGAKPATPRKTEETAPVSEADLDKALETLTTE